MEITQTQNLWDLSLPLRLLHYLLIKERIKIYFVFKCELFLLFLLGHIVFKNAVFFK